MTCCSPGMRSRLTTFGCAGEDLLDCVKGGLLLAGAGVQGKVEAGVERLKRVVGSPLARSEAQIHVHVWISAAGVGRDAAATVRHGGVLGDNGEYLRRFDDVLGFAADDNLLANHRKLHRAIREGFLDLRLEYLQRRLVGFHFGLAAPSFVPSRILVLHCVAEHDDEVAEGLVLGRVVGLAGIGEPQIERGAALFLADDGYLLIGDDLHRGQFLVGNVDPARPDLRDQHDRPADHDAERVLRGDRAFHKAGVLSRGLLAGHRAQLRRRAGRRQETLKAVFRRRLRLSSGGLFARRRGSARPNDFRCIGVLCQAKRVVARIGILVNRRQRVNDFRGIDSGLRLVTVVAFGVRSPRRRAGIILRRRKSAWTRLFGLAAAIGGFRAGRAVVLGGRCRLWRQRAAGRRIIGVRLLPRRSRRA